MILCRTMMFDKMMFREKMRKSIIMGALLCASALVSANEKLLPSLVQLNEPYTANMDLVIQSDVHIYVTYGSTATVSLEGTAVFDSAVVNTTRLSTTIHKSGKSVLIKNNANAGDAFSLGLVTNCGQTVSITVHGLANDVDANLIKPKLHILAANCS